MSGFVVFLAIAIGIIFYLNNQTNKLNRNNTTFTDEIWPFEKKTLLTTSERRFHELLKTALENEQIFTQVSLSQMIRVKNGHNKKSWYNRISRMSVDFVICDQDSNIIAAIELDDPSHDNIKRQADDAKKDKVLTCANINIIRWRVENMPSIEEIKIKVLNQNINNAEQNASNPSMTQLDQIAPSVVFMRPTKKNNTFLIWTTLGVIIFIATIATPNKPTNPNTNQSNSVNINTPINQENQILNSIKNTTPIPDQNFEKNSIEAQRQESLARQKEWEKGNNFLPVINFDKKNAREIAFKNQKDFDSVKDKAEEECRSWKNSYILEPTPEKKQYIQENCP